MDKITIPTSFNIELAFETPEFHRRLLAWIVDLLLLVCYVLISSRLLDSLYLSQPGSRTRDYNFYFTGTLVFAPVLVYHLVCELVLNGQSVGKKLLHLKVISETGGRPALHQFLLRWLLRTADFGLSLGLAGLLSSLLSAKGQRLGDMAAGTIVIKTSQAHNLDETVFFALDQHYQVQYPAVMRLSDRDMNVIKTILDNCRKTNNAALASRTAGKIRTVLFINGQDNDVAFLETMLKDYNYLSAQG